MTDQFRTMFIIKDITQYLTQGVISTMAQIMISLSLTKISSVIVTV